jgi:pimeloyl-ACP methyl ester carboxylesterase
VNDILGVLKYEDLQQIVLVGHSYGGMVISGVAEQASARVAQLVYLDAFLPEHGKSLKDYVPGAPLVEIAQARGDGWRLSHTWMGTTESIFSVTDPVDLAWVNALTGDQPLKTMLQPAQLPTDAASSLPRTYIQTTRDPWFVEAAERTQRTGFRSYELFSAGHDAMVTQPKELSELLLGLLSHDEFWR